MAESSSGSSSGIGFAGALTLVFITLKLTGFITWPWWVVLAPIWASLVAAVLVIVGFAGVTYVIAERRRRIDS